jgi:hypothetical protein
LVVVFAGGGGLGRAGPEAPAVAPRRNRGCPGAAGGSRRCWPAWVKLKRQAADQLENPEEGGGACFAYRGKRFPIV